MQLTITRDDLTGPQIHALLKEHLRHMYSVSPPESVHALDLTALRQPEITFWTAWDGAALAGCCALKSLGNGQAEVKSMRTSQPYRGKGVGRAMLVHLIAEARSRGYSRLSLETGAEDAFIPARTLYARHGFAVCAPFADYRDDPNSVFMTLAL